MTSNNYTCSEYRQEMILMVLKKRLAASELTPEEEKTIKTEIQRLEKSMGMD